MSLNGYETFFKSSSVDRYLGCSPLLAVVDAVAVYIILIGFACRSMFSIDSGWETVGLLVTMARFWRTC